jgi:hypothetical protein
MKLIIRAALLAASIGSIGTAYAAGGERLTANTQVPGHSDRAFAAIEGGSGAVRPVTVQYAAAKLLWDQNEGAEG